MAKFDSDNYSFDVDPSVLDYFKFDEDDPTKPHYNGAAHCLKAVDVIFELDDKDIYVEVKDYSKHAGFNPKCPYSKSGDFCANAKREKLVCRDIREKFVDTFLYRSAQGEPQSDRVRIANQGRFCSVGKIQ